MPTFEVDDQFHSHPKTAKTSLAALGVWVKAGSWCASYLTDGNVPRAVAIALEACPMGTPQGRPQGRPQGCPSACPLWDELVSVGLAEETPDGYRLHDYLHWNRPASEVQALRAKAAEKKRDQRAKMRARSKCPQGTPPRTTQGSTPILSPGESPLSPSPSPSPSNTEIPPSPPSGGNGVRKQMARKEPEPAPAETPAYAETVKAYFEEYERAKGSKPPFGSRDGAAVKKLLEAFGGDVARAKQCIHNALTDPYCGPRATICSIAADPAKHDGVGTKGNVTALPTKTRSGLLLQRDDQNESYAAEARRRSQELFASLEVAK